MLLAVNADVGTGNTIGTRAAQVAKGLSRRKVPFLVLCRDADRGVLPAACVRKVIFLGNRIPKLLTAIPIFIWKRFPSRRLQIWLFTQGAKRYIRNAKLMHSWEYAPVLSTRAKEQQMHVIQDVPIALNTVVKAINRKEKVFAPFEEHMDMQAVGACRLADRILAPSSFVKDSLLLGGISPKKITVIPFGVDVSRFRPTRKKSVQRFRAVFAGNINNRKGIKYLIEAWKSLSLPDADLHLYGILYPEARKYLHDAKKNHIIVHGFCDLSRELPKADIFVFASLLEGSAKVVYEALACGLPVVTTHNAGSVVEDGRDGFIVPIMDTQALAQKIRLLYDNPALRKKMGREARTKAKSYTWERYADSVLSVYKQLQAGRVKK